MLNDYKDKQLLAYNLFVKDIENNCVTHAYLIDENNYFDSFGMVLAFVKSILCNNNHYNDENCNECSLCRRIDEGNYPELKIVSADGMYIKKQQIIDLQQEFSRTAVEGKKRIYIIRDCDKMRTESANSMLKFLEEPEDDIVAILMTNNINNVLSTIVSRCKVIKLNNLVDDDIIFDDVLENLSIDFVFMLETKGINTILYIKDVLFSVISVKEKEKMVFLFDRMVDIYYDIMKVLTGSSNIKLKKWNDKIIELAKLNRLEDVLKKINILLEAKDSIKYNVNGNLLIDSLIISIGGITNDNRY